MLKRGFLSEAQAKADRARLTQAEIAVDVAERELRALPLCPSVYLFQRKTRKGIHQAPVDAGNRSATAS
jgi:hypothetical protein